MTSNSLSAASAPATLEVALRLWHTPTRSSIGVGLRWLVEQGREVPR